MRIFSHLVAELPTLLKIVSPLLSPPKEQHINSSFEKLL